MFKKINSSILIIIICVTLLCKIVYAANTPATDNGPAPDQESFPFDKECLKYDKANFKVGQALLEVMTQNDFPQYCVLYSLSNYQIKEKWNEGYFIIGSKLKLSNVQATVVYLKSNREYHQNQALTGHDSNGLNPIGQWAYFTGIERFVMEDGKEKEAYVFQEIDF